MPFNAGRAPSRSERDSRKHHQIAQALRLPFLVALLALSAFLLYRTFGRYDFDDLVTSTLSIPRQHLAAAMGWAAASYVCLTGFDWLALRYVRHPLPYRTTALASFVSLSIGHNVGFAALSSGAIRYRFYSRAGLSAEEVAKIILFCGVTVILGLAVLAGMTLLLRPDFSQAVIGLERPMILAIGAGCLVAPVAYLGLALVLRRHLCLWRWSFQMPNIRLAAAQMLIGPLNFAFVAACLHQTLSAVTDASYPAVASVYVIANVAAIISHVPGGLGVIESVVFFLLPHAELIGALIVFRFVYFLLPFCLGLTLFGITELRSRVSTTPA